VTKDEAITKWLGTPFVHAGRSETGLDCGNFIEFFFADLGFIDQPADKKQGCYSRDWFLHSKNQKLLNSIWMRESALIDKTSHFALFPYSDVFLFKEFDLILFSMARNGIANHVGIYLDGNNMLHCSESKGVRISPLCRFFLKRAVFVMRLEYGN